MTHTTLTDQPTQAAVARKPRADGDWSLLVFAVGVVAALPLLLWFGRDHWFYLDEFQILGADGLSNTGYLDGHNGHWITLLRLEYRLNFELWGLRTYLPYQVPAVLGHLVSAVLLRQVCRRLGARGWIATACALAFLFFGTGRENATLGFQVSLTGSLICGFGMLLLGDGPKTVTRRDWLVLGIGVVGLMTSGVFLALASRFRCRHAASPGRARRRLLWGASGGDLPGLVRPLRPRERVPVRLDRWGGELLQADAVGGVRCPRPERGRRRAALVVAAVGVTAAVPGPADRATGRWPPFPSACAPVADVRRPARADPGEHARSDRWTFVHVSAVLVLRSSRRGPRSWPGAGPL